MMEYPDTRGVLSTPHHPPLMLMKGSFGFGPDTFSRTRGMAFNLSSVGPNMHADLLGFHEPGKLSVSQRFAKPTVHKDKRLSLKSLIQPNCLIQVCGAMLVGKSTLVKETLSELCYEEGRHNTIQHHVSCKGLASLAQVLDVLFQELRIAEPANQIASVHQIQAVLSPWLGKHHVFVFHKCEAVRSNSNHYDLLDFFGELSQLLNSTVIFTTYKRFPRQANYFTLEIPMLSKISDIRALLNFYCCGSHACLDPGYVDLILRYNLCFPHAIRFLAQVYLQGEVIPSPDQMGENLQTNSLNFLEECLGRRLDEMESWLPLDKLKWIVHFCHSLDGSFTEELLWQMTGDDNNSHAGWNEMKSYLTDNFALWLEPGNKRLRFHPLLMLYFLKSLESRTLVLRGDWFDQSCNKVVQFLCGVLDKTEMVSRYHGNKLAMFQCLLPEWCNIKNAIQMAVHRKDYKVYWKVATMGVSILTKFSPDAAIDFFQAMVDNCRHNGFRSRKESAIMEGCLAYALAQDRECCWKEARQRFNSAIEVLSEEKDCSFFTAQILCNYARMLVRQGKYQKASRKFIASEEMLKESRREGCDEEQFYVSEWQRDELATTIDIYKTIPVIFHGDNVEALKSLHVILRDMENKKLYHFDYATVLNLMGLAVQRGKGNLDRSIFYFRQSLEERMHLMNVCPQDLVVPYNNLSMLLVKQGHTAIALQNLYNALAIRKRTGWKNYYTALTLAHIGDVHLNMDQPVFALDFYYQADEILAESSKNHDLRLRMNLALAHTSLAIDQKYDETKNSQPAPCSCSMNSGSLTSDHNRMNYLSANCRRLSNGETASSLPNTNTCDCKERLVYAFFSKKPATFFFRKVYTLAKQMKGTLSDHGHSQLMRSLEHLILLEWGNLTMVTKCFDRLTEVRTTYAWLANELAKPEAERKPFVNDHNNFYNYLSKNNLRYMDLKTAINLVSTHCEDCKGRDHYFCQSAWERVITMFQNNRGLGLDRSMSASLNSSRPLTLSSTSSDQSLSLSSTSSDQSDLNSGNLYMNFGYDNSSSISDNEPEGTVGIIGQQQKTRRDHHRGDPQNTSDLVHHAAINKEGHTPHEQSYIGGGFTYSSHIVRSPSPEEASWKLSDSLSLSNPSHFERQIADIHHGFPPGPISHFAGQQHNSMFTVKENNELLQPQGPALEDLNENLCNAYLKKDPELAEGACGISVSAKSAAPSSNSRRNCSFDNVFSSQSERWDSLVSSSSKSKESFQCDTTVGAVENVFVAFDRVTLTESGYAETITNNNSNSVLRSEEDGDEASNPFGRQSGSSPTNGNSEFTRHLPESEAILDHQGNRTQHGLPSSNLDGAHCVVNSVNGNYVVQVQEKKRCEDFNFECDNHKAPRMGGNANPHSLSSPIDNNEYRYRSSTSNSIGFCNNENGNDIDNSSDAVRRRQLHEYPQRTTINNSDSHISTADSHRGKMPCEQDERDVK